MPQDSKNYKDKLYSTMCHSYYNNTDQKYRTPRFYFIKEILAGKYGRFSYRINNFLVWSHRLQLVFPYMRMCASFTGVYKANLIR